MGSCGAASDAKEEASEEMDDDDELDDTDDTSSSSSSDASLSREGCTASASDVSTSSTIASGCPRLPVYSASFSFHF